MADLIITPASVLPVTTLSSNFIGNLIAAEAINAGESVYLNTSTNQWSKAIATALYSTFGIALNNAVAGQAIGVIANSGTLNLGVALTQGAIYAVSATVGGGKIGLLSDLITGQYVNILGYGNDANRLVLQRYEIPFALG